MYQFFCIIRRKEQKQQLVDRVKLLLADFDDISFRFKHSKYIMSVLDRKISGSVQPATVFSLAHEDRQYLIDFVVLLKIAIFSDLMVVHCKNFTSLTDLKLFCEKTHAIHQYFDFIHIHKFAQIETSLFSAITANNENQSQLLSETNELLDMLRDKFEIDKEFIKKNKTDVLESISAIINNNFEFDIAGAEQVTKMST